MTSFVLDASAVLAYAHGEVGGEVVRGHFDEAVISTVNWSEILRKSRPAGVAAGELHATLIQAGVSFLAFEEQDARMTADLWGRTKRYGLSLADRACLALARRLGVPAVTADRAWTTLDLDVEIVCIR